MNTLRSFRFEKSGADPLKKPAGSFWDEVPGTVNVPVLSGASTGVSQDPSAVAARSRYSSAMGRRILEGQVREIDQSTRPGSSAEFTPDQAEVAYQLFPDKYKSPARASREVALAAKRGDVSKANAEMNAHNAKVQAEKAKLKGSTPGAVDQTNAPAGTVNVGPARPGMPSPAVPKPGEALNPKAVAAATARNIEAVKAGTSQDPLENPQIPESSNLWANTIAEDPKAGWLKRYPARVAGYVGGLGEQVWKLGTTAQRLANRELVRAWSPDEVEYLEEEGRGKPRTSGEYTDDSVRQEVFRQYLDANAKFQALAKVEAGVPEIKKSDAYTQAKRVRDTLYWRYNQLHVRQQKSLQSRGM